MISRALAALALGSLLFIILPGCFQTGEATQLPTISPELIKRYQQTLAADQDNLTLHYLLGVALLQDNQNEAALEKLQVAYPAYQQSIEAHYNLAIAALRLGDLVSTEIYLEQAEDLGATETPGLYPIAGLYFNMAIKAQQAGDANEAIRYFYKVLALNPQQIEVFRQLGDLYANRNDTELALKSFRKYLEHFPEDTVSRDYLFALEFNKAQDMLAENDLDHAAEGFAVAIELQPNSPAALYYLGYIAYSQGNPEQAARFLNMAFPASEEVVKQSIRPLLYNTALSLRGSGKLQAARDAISTLVDQEKAFFNELFLAGTLNLELRQFRKALAYLQQAVTLKPEHKAAQQNLLAAELGAFNELLSEARLKLKTEDFSGADHALQKAAFLQPQSNKVVILEKRLKKARELKASHHFVAARTALDNGEFNAAASQVAAGLEAQPDNSDGLMLRESVSTAMEVDLNSLLAKAAQHSKAGSFDKAADSYAQVLAIAPRQQEALQGIKEVSRARQNQALEFLKKGLRALDEGQADLAAAAFEQALVSDPELEQARQGLASAEEMRANRLEEYLLKGRQALGSNRFGEARKWFQQALRSDNSMRVQKELAQLEKLRLQKAEELAIQAELAARSSHFKKAQKLFNQALKLVPEHQRSLAGQVDVAFAIESSVKKQLKQASLSLDQNNYSSALTTYRLILELSPQNAIALDGLKKIRKLQAVELDDQVRQGQEALAAGNWPLAEEHLKKALQKDAYHKGAQQLRQKVERVRQSGADPGEEQDVYLQGVVYYTQGHYNQAIKAWETVLVLNPEHEKSIQNIDKTRRKIRQIEEYRGN